MIYRCEKHGTPYRTEEVREYPGKTVQVCDDCRGESESTMRAFVGPSGNAFSIDTEGGGPPLVSR